MNWLIALEILRWTYWRERSTRNLKFQNSYFLGYDAPDYVTNFWRHIPNKLGWRFIFPSSIKRWRAISWRERLLSVNCYRVCKKVPLTTEQIRVRFFFLLLLPLLVVMVLPNRLATNLASNCLRVVFSAVESSLSRFLTYSASLRSAIFLPVVWRLCSLRLLEIFFIP